MMKFKTQDFGSEKSILAFPNPYVNMPQVFSQNSALSVDVNGRKIIKAGTFYPSNDANAVGLVFSDLDVTDGDVNGAVLIFGFVATDKLPQAPTQQAINALKMVQFLPIKKSIIDADTKTVNTADYANSKVRVTVYGTSFLEGAATTSNWSVVDTNGTNVQIASITKVDSNNVDITFKTAEGQTAKAGTFKISANAAAVTNGIATNALEVTAAV